MHGRGVKHCGVPRLHGCLRVSTDCAFCRIIRRCIDVMPRLSGFVVRDWLIPTQGLVAAGAKHANSCLRGGSHGPLVAACSVDHPPLYRLYYAASCTAGGSRCAPLFEFRAMSDTNAGGKRLLLRRQRTRKRLWASTGCAFCRLVRDPKLLCRCNTA